MPNAPPAQLGCRFWELALREHASYTRGGRYDEPLACLFANVDARSGAPLPLADGRGPLRTLRARCVLVDMEEGVLASLLRGPLGASEGATKVAGQVAGCWAALTRTTPLSPLSTPPADLFDPAQLLHRESSGSGNNWARGARLYGAPPSPAAALPPASPHYKCGQARRTMMH